MSRLGDLGKAVEESDERAGLRPSGPERRPFRPILTIPLRGAAASFLGSASCRAVIAAHRLLSHAAYNPGTGRTTLPAVLVASPSSTVYGPGRLYSLTQSLHRSRASPSPDLWRTVAVTPLLFEGPPVRSVRLARAPQPLAAGRLRDLPPRHGRHQHRVLAAVRLRLPPRSLLRGHGLPRRPLPPPRAEAADRRIDLPPRRGVPAARRGHRPDAGRRSHHRDDAASPAPAEPTISRRGMLWVVGLGSLGWHYDREWRTCSAASARSRSSRGAGRAAGRQGPTTSWQQEAAGSPG